MDKIEDDNKNIESKQKNSENINSLDDMFDDANIKNKSESQSKTLITDEEDSYDLQKELEAKFDELFGPIDEE